MPLVCAGFVDFISDRVPRLAPRRGSVSPGPSPGRGNTSFGSLSRSLEDLVGLADRVGGGHVARDDWGPTDRLVMEDGILCGGVATALPAHDSCF